MLGSYGKQHDLKLTLPVDCGEAGWEEGGELEIHEEQYSCWVCNFVYFVFWCSVEPIWIFVSRFSSKGILYISLKDPDWANTGLLCYFFTSSGNSIFLAFVKYEFIQASTICGFLPTQFPWGHFVRQVTRIAYWEAQASAPIMLLIVLWEGFDTMVVEMCWKNIIDKVWFSSFKHV